MASKKKSRTNLYGYEKKYENLLARLKKKLSKKNYKTVTKFNDQLIIEQQSFARKIRTLYVLIVLAGLLTKDFVNTSLEDIKKVIIKLEKRVQNKELKPATIELYKVITKKFFSWLEYGDDYRIKVKTEGYPKKIRWIITTLKAKDKTKVNASDLLTEDEILALINSAESVRDKCFISMLYELGARISEAGLLKYKSVSRDADGYYQADLHGKTGHRTPRLIMSDKYITNWLNQHPTKKPEDPLWVCTKRKWKRDKDKKLALDKTGNKILVKTEYEPMNYVALRNMILRIKAKAAIKKRLYAHLFRHSRVTHLLRSSVINESQAKVYFGWTPSSSQLSTYSHLVSADVNDSLLALYGIKVQNTNGQKLKVPVCPRCDRPAELGADYCDCGQPVTKEGIAKTEKKQNKHIIQVIESYLKERGAISTGKPELIRG